MLTSSYPRFPGDIAGTFVKSLATHIVQLGHEVHVLAPDDGPVRNRTESGSDGGVAEHRFVYAPNDRLRILGYAKSLEGDRRLRPLAYAMILPYAIVAYTRLRLLAAKYSCDIIHAHWVLPSGPIAAATAKAIGCPLVTSLHGSDVYVAERHRLFRQVARRVLQRSICVTSCSSNLRDRAVRIGANPRSAVVIPYGVSPELFSGTTGAGVALRQRLAIDDSNSVILCLGRLVYKKGFEYLVEAM